MSTGRLLARTHAGVARVHACIGTNLPGKKNGKSYRFNDPLVGDKVEVSWEGRFRLESLDVFVGKSWWEATVVQKVEGYM